MCDMAERELIQVDAAGLALPGDFNTSASTLLGGAHAGLFAGDKSWAQEAEKEGVSASGMGLREQEARIKFRIGVAALGTDEQQDLVDKTSLKIVKKESTGLEVAAINFPDKATTEVYAAETEIVKTKLDHLEPLGKLICSVWYVEDCDEWDLPKDKYPDGKPHKVDQNRMFEFWVEKHVLNKCFVGMKMDANIMILEGGTTILDEVKQTYCSFFTWLPNELWMDNKPKDVRWLAKGLPDYDEDAELNLVKKDDQDKNLEGDELDDE